MVTLRPRRRKMFFRLVVLFGALVAVPLAVSGMLLSVIGRSSVLQVGNNMTTTGAHTMRASSDRLIRFATRSFTDSASHLIDLSRQQLEDAHQQQVKKSTETLQQLSRGLRVSGSETLRETIDQMASDSRRLITQSNELLRKKQAEAVNKLSRELTAQVRAAFSKTAQQLNEQNRGKMEELVKDLNNARTQFFADRAVADITEAHDALITLAQHPLLPVVLFTPRRPFPLQETRERLQGMLQRMRPLSLVEVALVRERGLVVISRQGISSEDSDFFDAERFPFRQRAFDAVKNGATFHVSPVIFPEDASNSPQITLACPVLNDRNKALIAVLIADMSLENLSRIAFPRTMTKSSQNKAEPEEASAFIVQKEGRIVAHSDRRRVGTSVGAIYQDVVRSAFSDREKESNTHIVGTGDKQSVVSWQRISVSDTLDWVVIAAQPLSEVTLFSQEVRQSIDEAANAAATTTEKEMLNAAQDAMRQFAAEQERLAKQIEAHIRRVSTSAMEERLRKLEGYEKKAVQTANVAIATQGEQVKETLKTLEVRLEQATTQEAQRMRGAAEKLVGTGVRDMQQQTARMANEPARRMLKNSILLIAVFLVLAVGLAAATAKSIVTPVEELLDGTTALAAGDYAKRVPVKSDDEIGLLAAAFNDMATAVERSRTELEHTNERLAEEKARIQHIIEGIPDGVVMVNHAGEVVFFNSAMQRMLARDTSQDGSGQMSLRDAALQPFAERIEAALQEPQDITLDRPRRRVLRLRAVSIKDDVGQPGRLLLLHDVTREHEVDEIKNSFIALVSHELRTPLTSILAFSSYMLTDKLGLLTDAQRTGVESMYRQAKRLSAIISDFLDLSRIESGRVRMQKQPVALNQIAQRVVEELRPQAEEKHINVTIHTPEGSSQSGVIALADEQRIAQVFTNLLGNAFKFTDPHGTVDISLSADDGSVLVRVSDTGCGIAPEELPKIFDRFYQVERVVTRKTGGTGLGLAIVKNIVEAHGGKVWVTSRIGEGTSVFFTLPR